MSQAQLRQILTHNKFSLSAPRRLVFKTLLAHQPVSMAELTGRLAGQADRASVYRCVKLYEELGIVHRINIGWKYKLELSDLFNDHHHHAHCQQCGMITNLPISQELEILISSLARRAGFQENTHQLELYGLCAKCLGMTDIR